MLRSWELYRRLIAIRIRAQMQYRVSFLADILISTILGATGFLSLALVIEKFAGVGGWQLWEIAFLYGMVENAFGWMDMIFSGFDPQHFGRMYVRTGAFDQMLLRPASLLAQVFGSEFILRRIGRILQASIILGLALVNLTIDWDAGRVLYIPVIFTSLIAFFGGLFVIGATITFWTVESIEAINVLTYGGSEMFSYPMHIYPSWLRQFFTYIIPGIFLNYYPALYILGKPDPLGLPAFAPFLSPLAGFGILALGLAFWQFGLNHYQSTGT